MIRGVRELNLFLGREIKNLENLRNDLVVIAEKVKDDMINRTKSGVDVNGTGFEKYTTKYAKRKLKNVGSNSPVNLTYENQMLRDWKVKRITEGASIYFKEGINRKKASVHNYGEGKQKRREFIGLDKNNISYVVSEIRKRLKDE